MRFDLDSYTEVLDTITRNKTRSLLTGFGVFWGLFMLLFMMGTGDGVRKLLYENFEGFAMNTCIMVSNTTTMPYKGMKEGRYWQLEQNDLKRLPALIPELELVTPVVSMYNSSAIYGDLTSDCSVKGLLPEYSRIETPQIKYGRYINQVDVELKRKVCVIGKTVYKNLFSNGEDPCGKYIKIGPVYYQVVGVDFSSGNISINGSADKSISVPLPLAQQLYNRGKNVDLICMTAKEGVVMSSLEDRIREVMGRAHSFDPEDKDALVLVNTEQLFSLVDNIFKGINFLIWLIGLGTLLAGAIGVSNIMMVTVRERTTEIGIRRAIGATPRDVLTQIMAESVGLTFVSGMMSILFSVFVLYVGGIIGTNVWGSEVNLQISFGLAIGAIFLLMALGLLAGLAPALRAMEIKPVDAMRDE